MKNIMKHNRLATGLIAVLVLTLSVVVYAQVNRPYRNGSVWDIGFIQMKPGMETAYLTYIADGWKRGQEALKKDGQIISYKVLVTETHGSDDWNIMLMTEYKDLATMEANEAKADNLTQTVIGNDDWSNQPRSDRIIAAAARVGAFPLDTAAYDAAVLVTLPPGAYTVHVASELINTHSRDVLVEVYGVPEDIFD